MRKSNYIAKGMGSLRVKGKKQRIYARFYYLGQQREEPLAFYCAGSGQTGCKCRDHKAALCVLAEIERKIDAELFDYKDYFPTSSALKGLGQSVIDKSITFGAYASAWLEQQQLTFSTLKAYKSVLYAHLIPAFGAMPMKDVLPFHIRQFIVKLDKSPKYIKNIIGVLSVIFSSAMDDRLVENNPCERVKSPHVEVSQVDPLSLDETKKIIDYINKKWPHIGLYFAIGFYMGMRTGEILGLQWGDFDFNNHTITVQRTTTQGKVKNSTKTSDFRIIEIPPILDGYIENQKQYTFLKSDWVFLNYRGDNFLHLGIFSKRYWEPALKVLGIKYRQMYQMRHSFACNALLLGFDVPYIQQMLGHSTPQMIYRRYGNCISKNSSSFRRGFGFEDLVKKGQNKG